MKTSNKREKKSHTERNADETRCAIQRSHSGNGSGGCAGLVVSGSGDVKGLTGLCCGACWLQCSSPTTGVPPPESHYQSPTTRVPPPESHYQSPTTRVPPPESHRQSPSTRVPPPESHQGKYQVMHSKRGCCAVRQHNLLQVPSSSIHRHVPEFLENMEYSILIDNDGHNAAAAQHRTYWTRALLAYGVLLVVVLAYTWGAPSATQASAFQAPSAPRPVSLAQAARLVPPPLSATPTYKTYTTDSGDVIQAESWEAAERIAHQNHAAREIARRKALDLHTNALYSENWDGDYYIGSGFNIMTVLLLTAFLVPAGGLLFAWASYGSLWGTTNIY